MYKIKNGLAPDHITELFDTSNKGCNLRNGDFVILRFDTIRYGKHSLRYTGPHIRSKLNNKEKDIPSLGLSKHYIKNKDTASLIEHGCQSCRLCSM